MGKYRRKPLHVTAYQLVDRDWLVIEDNGKQDIYSPKQFEEVFEPVEELIDTGIGIFPASQAVRYEGEALPLGDRKYAVAHPDRPASVLDMAQGTIKIIDPSKL